MLVSDQVLGLCGAHQFTGVSHKVQVLAHLAEIVLSLVDSIKSSLQ